MKNAFRLLKSFSEWWGNTPIKETPKRKKKRSKRKSRKKRK